MNAAQRLLLLSGRSASLASRAAAIALAKGGALYDPSDLTSLYQSRTGGSTGASGSVVGIMLDKSKMGGQAASAYIAARPRLETNGEFANLTGWTTGTGLSSVANAGRAEITRSGAIVATSAFKTIVTTTSGKWYVASYTIANDSGAARNITNATGAALTGLNPSSVGNGTHTNVFQANDSATHFNFWGTDGGTMYLSAFSVREIPGFHALAPSDAARPLLTVSGKLAYLTTDGVDDTLRTSSMTLQYAMMGWREISIPNSYHTIIGQAGRTNEIVLAHDLSTSSNAILYATNEYLVNGAGPYADGSANNPIPRTTDRVFEVTNGTAVAGIVALAARAATWQGVGGRVYGFIALPTIPSAAEATTLRQYMASLSGVTL